MKIGLVGYQGGGKSTVFELLTGIAPDPAKAHTGQVGVARVPDERFDKLVEQFAPKKVSPARIELFDTPGLNSERQERNAQRLGVIREAHALVQIIGCFAGRDPLSEVTAFEDDLILADLEVVANRMERLKTDVTKPRPDREELSAELEALRPIETALSAGESLLGFDFSELQDAVCKSFSLLTRKPRLIVLNTADADYDSGLLEAIRSQGLRVIAAPFGLELEVESLPPEDRAEFAAEMGLADPCRENLLRGIFDVTDQITFYTCDEKEVHAWLLRRGETALDAAGTIHTDLARGFIRAEIMATEDLLRLGSEREVKAAGLHHLEGKEYVMRDGDEIVVRFSV